MFGCKNSEIKVIDVKYKNGKPKRIYYYKAKNKLNYREEVFYESGKIEYIGSYIDNKKEGVWNWWYENGKIRDKCTFINNKEVDTIFHWYENGKLKEISVLKKSLIDNGINCSTCCNSTVTLFYENGNTKEYYTLINNMLNDSFKTWYNNGKPDEIGYYLNDNKEGIWKKYSENGWWLTRTYHNGVCSGTITEFQIDSTNTIHIIKGQYKNNKETGKWIWYNKDSIITQTRIYNNGKEIDRKIF